ncbi:DsbA family oxidoreductase [Catenovulum sp. 2E275]|uniref:DsbA family oxidoreductase n=1 Tax=Catenovulum sp. 2E275 TaxID=2980497 RepID=UPI0021D2B263|nr:DsbA family oxidoreductase [Catenovulum sp. 2E275]MCU4674661.1 DsbA family oxidoreductase [Catenovulum sp. 2E275]
MKKLSIQIVSDVMCPWCIIGYNNLKAAIDELAESTTTPLEVEISWLPFELNPNMPLAGQDLEQHLMEKYGLTPEQGAANRDRIEQMGLQSGFKFNLSGKRIMVNTFDCHRLLSWAKQFGKQTELKLALFKAHFQDGLYLNQTETLLDITQNVGLNRQDAQKILESDQFSDRVKQEQNQLKQMGISSVPTFIINQKYAISGGQPKQSFVQSLMQIATE